MPEASPFLQRFLDVRVCVEDALTSEELNRLEKMSGGSDRSVDLQTVLAPRQEVVRAMARSGVHRARALLERHVVGEHADRIAIVERMPEADPFELLAFHPCDRTTEWASDRLRHAFGQALRDDDRAAVYL